MNPKEQSVAESTLSVHGPVIEGTHPRDDVFPLSVVTHTCTVGSANTTEV